MLKFDANAPAALATHQLTLAYDGNTIIQGLDLAIPQGKMTTLVGPNGCGKSTLLRGMARLLAPKGGTVYLKGEAIAQLPTKELAKRLGILPQSPSAPEGLTVRELVAQGRYPHQTWFKQWSQDDEHAVEAAIATTHLQEFANRPIDTLSGGQRQRAWIAMALAQNTDTLLLDEPTTYLDLAHQIEVLDLLYHLNQQGGRTIVMVLHDLNLACRYSHHLVALRDGLLMAQGTPTEVVTEAMVQQVFNLKSRILTDPISNTPLCLPITSVATVGQNHGDRNEVPHLID
ncbi:ABC transporter ATP-binding protein [Leptolyngbya sp. AN02str]|uniref:ABC transporter ATP-binding protein n=1 Tax=Leptolyngbya sp. AN02str TaxID=3423363 RepID=UPI003D322E59